VYFKRTHPKVAILKSLQGIIHDPLALRYTMTEEKLIIDVIDNGGQWTHREWRMLRYLGVDTQILSNKTPLSELRKVDGLILSGGAARVGLTGELGNCAEYLTLEVPILGNMCWPSIYGRALWW
jgi:hypothetical protein